MMTELQKRSAVRLRILRFTPCFQITLPGVDQAGWGSGASAGNGEWLRCEGVNEMIGIYGDLW
jgi:hypothetical protein